MCAHEVDQVCLDLDDLLAGSRPCRFDVAGEREGPGTQVHGGNGLAGHPELVDHMPDALDVLEEELARIFEVHVRLRGSVDDEREAARYPLSFRIAEG
jgi:hypothetical protein